MARELKVYGWMGFHRGGQYRMIVAARSVAEVSRISGYSRYELINYGDWTGNDVEREVALTEPGVIFYGSVSPRRGEEYRKLESE